MAAGKGSGLASGAQAHHARFDITAESGCCPGRGSNLLALALAALRPPSAAKPWMMYKACLAHAMMLLTFD